ncbi:unnamed protein product [Ceutorhynchus assimilis]|uniref:Uncharacterized protein n=1 Tax=Ceutorhynchus assimilis TaxID=467358 RepID=A0A9N9MY60_9CUCU|nr:unnamed protein product [Ceutorhynchus assimilis]
MTPTDSTSPLRNSWPDSGTEEAPPLPPRSHTPDKRVQSLPNDAPPNIPKRGQKKSCNVSECDLIASATIDAKDLRDSGISMNEAGSTLNNFNTQNCYEDYELRQHPSEMNISGSPPDQRNSQEEHPPPIPPKIGGSLSSSIDLGGSLERPSRSKDPLDILSSSENYSHPKIRKESDGDK